MSIVPGQPVSAGTDNAAFLSRLTDSDTIAVVGLKNAGSGGNINNTQLVQNRLMTATGVQETGNNGTTYGAPPNTITDGDNHEQALTILANKLDATGGHTHDGNDGEGGPISGFSLINVPLRGYIIQGVDLTGVTGTSKNVSTELSGYSPSSSSIIEGVVVNAPSNKIIIRQASGVNEDDSFVDGSGNVVFGRLSEALGVWTLSFYVMISGTETAYNFTTSSDIRWYFQSLFNPMVNPPVYSEFASIPSENATSDVVDATTTQRGVINATTQSFGGVKTFADTTNSTSPTTGALKTSGGLGVALDAFFGGKINQGSFGGAAKALASNNGKDIVESSTTATELGYVSGVTSSIQTQLNAKAADSSVVHLAGPETITGDKTFNGKAIFGSFLQLTETVDSTTTGSIASATPTTTIWRLTNASLVSLSNLASPLSGETLVLINDTGNSITVLNDSGGTAANRILTGTGADLTLANNACLLLTYSPAQARWRVVGGSGGSGTGASLEIQVTAGENLAVDDAIYISKGNANGDTGRTLGQAYKLDATNDNRMYFAGINKTVVTAGNAATIQIGGEITFGSGLTQGLPLFASVTTPGAYQTTATTTVGQWSIMLGDPSAANKLIMNGALGSTAIKIANTSFTAPTVQKFTSGSGTYTPPANVKYIIVEMAGGGGGGGGSGSAPNVIGGAGGNTTFGTSLLTANGGGGGDNNANSAIGGAGGSVTINSPAVNLIGVIGAYGQGSSGNFGPGGQGGSTAFGGAGGGGFVGHQSGIAASANSGSGGGGAGSNGSTIAGGGGGGAGGYIKALISSPTSYAYSIGAGGTGGSAASKTGGAGGSGVIIVTEYY